MDAAEMVDSGTPAGKDGTTSEEVTPLLPAMSSAALAVQGGRTLLHQPDLRARLIGPRRTVWNQSEARDLIGRCAKPRPVWLGSALEDGVGAG